MLQNTIPYSSDSRIWHGNSSVATPRDVELPLKYTATDIFFPPELVPLINHKICQERGDAFVRKVLVHHLYAYLDFTEVLEHAAVNQACCHIAREDFGIDFSSTIKLDAYRICVDESFHALRSAEVKQQIQDATEVYPVRIGEPAFIRGLNKLQDTVDSSIRNLLQVFFVIITETAITGNLMKIPKNRQVVSIVRDLVTEHASDEKQHCLYFENLLKLIWEQLTPEKRTEIGSLLPQLIFIFLKQDLHATRAYLETLDLDAPEIDAIVHDTFTESAELERIKRSIQPTLLILRRNGVLSETGVMEAFQASGLM